MKNSGRTMITKSKKTSGTDCVKLRLGVAYHEFGLASTYLSIQEGLKVHAGARHVDIPGLSSGQLCHWL